MEGQITIEDGKYIVDGYILHPSQSWPLMTDLSNKWVSQEDIFNKMHEYKLEYNPGDGPWLYAVVNGLRDQRNYDLEW
jgi:hypothetical protein